MPLLPTTFLLGVTSRIDELRDATGKDFSGDDVLWWPVVVLLLSGCLEALGGSTDDLGVMLLVVEGV